MKFVFPILFFSIFCLRSTYIFANSTSSDDIIISAEKIETSLKKSSNSKIVINNDEIKKSKNLSLKDALSASSSITVASSGTKNSTTSIFLRGTDASHTTIILDGVILNDPSNPNKQFDLSNINLNEIESIEILKGSQGHLYGSNSIGGVIILHSKKIKSKHNEIGINLDTHSTLGVNASTHNEISSKLKTSSSVHINKSQGHSASTDPSPTSDKDGHLNYGINLKANYQFSTVDSINFAIDFKESENDLDKGGGPGTDDPNYKSKNQAQYSYINYEKIWNDTYSFKTQISNSYYKRRAFDNLNSGQTYDGSYYAQGSFSEISSDHFFLFTNNDKLNLNLMFFDEKSMNKNLTSYALSTYYKKYLEQSFEIQVGFRQDYHEIYHENQSYKLGIIRPIDQTYYKLAYSTGFKAPSINQLYDSTYGNKNLRPEKSKSIETGIERKNIFNVYDLELNLFYTHLSNRITYHPVTYVNQNAGKAFIRGIELDHRLQINNASSIKNSNTILHAFDLNKQKKLARRPSVNSSFNYQYILSDKNLFDLGINFKGKTPDVDNLGNDTINQAFYTLNFKYQYHFNELSNATLNILNLLNSSFEETWGYYNGGRTISLDYHQAF